MGVGDTYLDEPCQAEGILMEKLKVIVVGTLDPEGLQGVGKTGKQLFAVVEADYAVVCSVDDQRGGLNVLHLVNATIDDCLRRVFIIL